MPRQRSRDFSHNSHWKAACKKKHDMKDTPTTYKRYTNRLAEHKTEHCTDEHGPQSDHATYAANISFDRKLHGTTISECVGHQLRHHLNPKICIVHPEMQTPQSSCEKTHANRQPSLTHNCQTHDYHTILGNTHHKNKLFLFWPQSDPQSGPRRNQGSNTT